MSNTLPTKERSQFLANRLFDGVDPCIPERLADFGRLVSVERGTVVFNVGDPSDHLLLVLKGLIRLLVSGTLIARRRAGEWIGEQGIIDATGRSTDAIAETDAVLFYVPAESVVETCTASSSFSLNIARLISAKLRESSIGRGHIYSRELRLLSAVRNRVSEEAFNSIFTDYEKSDVQTAPVFEPVPARSELAVVMVTDIRSFSSLAERLSLLETQAVLRRYFTDVVDILERHSIYIDKYMGDGILAYSLPRLHADCYERTIRSALEIVNLSADYSPRTGERISTGIGIHCGNLLIGDFGAASHFEYTIIGDTVNVASRLQDQTKRDNVPLIISTAVYASLEPGTQQRFGDRPHSSRVRNRETEVEYYQLRR